MLESRKYPNTSLDIRELYPLTPLPGSVDVKGLPKNYWPGFCKNNYVNTEVPIVL